MNQKPTGLSQRYVTALRKHLKPGTRVNLQPMLGLGRRAVTLGLETLDLARIHERALVILKLSAGNVGPLRRAGIFFAGANAPIEETHLAARQSRACEGRLRKTLGQRTAELAATNRRLQKGVARRKFMQQAADKTSSHHNQCLENSLQLQRRLRELAHRVLTVQEDERKHLSQELQDEIAQTLLGINVRLLSLKQNTRTNTRGLRNEIASTQRLVASSARNVRRLARELNVRH